MEFDDYEAELDDIDAIEFEPKKWMVDTERVIDVYKNEVDSMRKKIRLFAIEFEQAMKLVRSVHLEQTRLRKLLDENRKP